MRVSSCLTDHGEIGIIVDQVDQTTSDHFVVVNEKHRDHNCSPLPRPSPAYGSLTGDRRLKLIIRGLLSLVPYLNFRLRTAAPLGPSMSTDEHLEDYY